VLLTSVFGPYAQDDEYGSRALNPMELYHNQVTREQRAFSVRMFHRSHPYDIVGIGAIQPNVGKVQKMCELVRQHLPDATIVVGGHVANLPDLDELIDADHIVKGEGVRWMRRFLSEDENRPIRHPHILSGIGARTMGVTPRGRPGDTAATLIPSVGCPMGCNFCATSAMFGGKGKFVHFYETGDELFEVMCELEEAMRVRSFFVMDENFLLYRKRALRLLDLMAENDKPWALYVFSSANVLGRYTMEQLVALGVSWVWMGLEGPGADYVKLKGIDTRRLVRTLQSHGINTCLRTSTRPSSTPWLTTRSFISSCCIHPSAVPRCTPNMWRTAHCSIAGNAPRRTGTGSSGSAIDTSTSGTGRKRSSCERRSISTSG
jgi:hypothetical protein